MLTMEQRTVVLCTRPEYNNQLQSFGRNKGYTILKTYVTLLFIYHYIPINSRKST